MIDEKEFTGKIILTNRKELSLNGVQKVNSATENVVNLKCNQTDLIIQGSDLHIKKLDIEQRFVEIEGQVDSMKYTKGSSKKNGFIKRIFK